MPHNLDVVIYVKKVAILFTREIAFQKMCFLCKKLGETGVVCTHCGPV